jgi:hypothetical protein
MSWKKINKIKFYCYYYEGINIPIMIEARNKVSARQILRNIRSTLPDIYQKSFVVGETIKPPVTGISTKKVNGKDYVWVGEDYTPDGWIEREKYNNL